MRQALVDVYLRERTLLLLGARLRAAAQAGRAPGPEASVGKIAITALDKIATGLALNIVGRGRAWPGRPTTARPRSSERAFLQAPGISIAGGTTEVQKNIIGERVLGLPKEPQVDRDMPFRDLLVGTQTRSSGLIGRTPHARIGAREVHGRCRARVRRRTTGA